MAACGVIAVLVAGCGPVEAIPGTAEGTGEIPTTTTTRPPTTTSTTTTTRSPATPVPPLTVDEDLPVQHCDRTFTGALGKPMHAVVVETPGGILDCEEAAAILFDYYAERSDPTFGLPPIHIGPLACNQAEEGQFPQVICADEDNLIYSMWPQT